MSIMSDHIKIQDVVLPYGFSIKFVKPNGMSQCLIQNVVNKCYKDCEDHAIVRIKNGHSRELIEWYMDVSGLNIMVAVWAIYKEIYKWQW